MVKVESGLDMIGKVESESVAIRKVESRTDSIGTVESGSEMMKKVESESDTTGKVESGSDGIGKAKSESVAIGKVESGSDTTGKVESGSAAIGKTENGSVAIGKVESGSDTTGKVESGSDTTGKVESGSAAIGKTENGSVAIGKVESGSDTTGKVESGSDTTGKVESGSAAIGKTENGSVAIGKVESGSDTTGKVESGSDTTGKVESGSDTTGKVESGSDTTGKVESGSDTTGKVESGSAAIGKTENGSVAIGKVESGSDTTGKVESRSVTRGKVENGTRSIERMEGERDKLTSVKMNLNEPIKRKENRTTPLTFQGQSETKIQADTDDWLSKLERAAAEDTLPITQARKDKHPQQKGVEKNLDSSFQEQLEELVNRRKEVENMWMSRKLSVKQVEDRKGLMTVNRTEIAGNVKSGEEANQREDEKLLSWVKMLIETMKIWNSINFKKLMGNLELKEGQTFWRTKRWGEDKVMKVESLATATIRKLLPILGIAPNTSLPNYILHLPLNELSREHIELINTHTTTSTEYTFVIAKAWNRIKAPEKKIGQPVTLREKEFAHSKALQSLDPSEGHSLPNTVQIPIPTFKQPQEASHLRPADLPPFNPTNGYTSWSEDLTTQHLHGGRTLLAHLLSKANDRLADTNWSREEIDELMWKLSSIPSELKARTHKPKRKTVERTVRLSQEETLNRAVKKWENLVARGKTSSITKEIEDMNAGRTQSLSFDEVKQRITALHNDEDRKALYLSVNRRTREQVRSGEKLEIRNATNGLNSNSTPSLDGLTAEFVKRCCRNDKIVEDQLGNLISLCLERNYLPQAWCVCRMVGIPKTDGKIRPIAVQHTLRKLMARLLLERNKGWLQRHTSPRQVGVGVRNGRSVVVDAVEHAIDEAIQQRTTQFIVMLDMSNAFQNVRRQQLLNKLADIEDYDAELLHFIRNSFEQETLILSRGEETAAIPNSRGVQQGCPLSPSLFAFYITEPMRQAEAGGATAWGYLDDLVLMANSEAQLNRSLTKLSTSLTAHGLTLNPTKTVIMSVVDGVPSTKPINVLGHGHLNLKLVFSSAVGFLNCSWFSERPLEI
ncbi:putative Glutamine-rich protein [Blattamonas nauphoetae]|uniref:Glutamine-rich protein n=1 Tax=Blattamonas nauphoetae TaxID=2049346 RepID=A0ABQ9WU16_9EUKA|nr:putative Glutamine-rich protein [Blattamonas nauphoetae]